MKIPAIKSACMARKTFVICTTENGAQWVGNGPAMWPVDGIILTEKNLPAVFDLTEKQMGKLYIRILDSAEGPLDPRIMLEDWPNEIHCETPPLCFWHQDELLRPVITEAGLMLINVDLLKPVGKKKEYLEFYMRSIPCMPPLIAGKTGLLTDVLIAPLSVDSTRMILKYAGALSEYDIVDYPVSFVVGMDVKKDKYYAYEGKVYLAKDNLPACHEGWAPGTDGMWQWEEIAP